MCELSKKSKTGVLPSEARRADSRGGGQLPSLHQQGGLGSAVNSLSGICGGDFPVL